MLLATYNVLATAYVEPEWYRDVPSELLEPARRRAAVVARLEAIDADVWCFQEVEAEVAEALTASLTARGYQGRWQRKGRGRPDGCATFWRNATLLEASTLYYDDAVGGGVASGHLALLTRIDLGGRELGVVNTHLKWDEPGKPPGDRWCVRQARALSRWLTGAPRDLVVCGDLNVTAHDVVVEELTLAGFRDVFARSSRPHTCRARGKTAKIDHVLVRGCIEGTPGPAAAIEGQGPLPNLDEPSDHVPLVAKLEWTR